jgi:hypothetical protein
LWLDWEVEDYEGREGHEEGKRNTHLIVFASFVLFVVTFKFLPPTQDELPYRKAVQPFLFVVLQKRQADAP